MLRLVVVFAAFVSLGQWCVEEIALLFPEGKAFISKTLDVMRIPTHDEWDPETVEAVKNKVEKLIERL